METVYDNGFRSWASDVGRLDIFLPNLKQYPVTVYSTGKTEKCKEREMHSRILDVVNPEMSVGEFAVLLETSKTETFKVPEKPVLVDVPSMKKNPGLFEEHEVPSVDLELKTLTYLKLMKRNNEETYSTNLKYRSNVWPTVKPNQEEDLNVHEHLLVTVRIYHPFRHRLGLRNLCPPRCSQELLMLGEQNLCILRDKIVCASDMSATVEVSDNPDVEIDVRAKDVYKSGFFFIEDTFYNDMRDPNNIDYSRVIRKWAEEHELGPFSTALMEDTIFLDLKLKFGYPYVYQHQGNCEHLLVFSDARSIAYGDCLVSADYPLTGSLCLSNAQYCMICGMYMARFVTTENERVPHDPCYFCEYCFKSYNYIDGKKIGNFKAYPFFGKP